MLHAYHLYQWIHAATDYHVDRSWRPSSCNESELSKEPQEVCHQDLIRFLSHTIHGTIVYLPTWMVDFYGINVGKYTSPMDGMGLIICNQEFKISFIFPTKYRCL